MERMDRGEQAIIDECEAHASEEEKRELHYVLKEKAGDHEEGRVGFSIVPWEPPCHTNPVRWADPYPAPGAPCSP